VGAERVAENGLGDQRCAGVHWQRSKHQVLLQEYMFKNTCSRIYVLRVGSLRAPRCFVFLFPVETPRPQRDGGPADKWAAFLFVFSRVPRKTDCRLYRVVGAQLSVQVGHHGWTRGSLRRGALHIAPRWRLDVQSAINIHVHHIASGERHESVAGNRSLSSRRGQPLFCSAGICACAARAKYYPACGLKC
jgi:hypothetical protein